MNIIDPAFTINKKAIFLIRQNPPNYSMKMKNYTILERKFRKKGLIPFTQSI